MTIKTNSEFRKAVNDNGALVIVDSIRIKKTNDGESVKYRKGEIATGFSLNANQSDQSLDSVAQELLSMVHNKQILAFDDAQSMAQAKTAIEVEVAEKVGARLVKKSRPILDKQHRHGTLPKEYIVKILNKHSHGLSDNIIGEIADDLLDEYGDIKVAMKAK